MKLKTLMLMLLAVAMFVSTVAGEGSELNAKDDAFLVTMPCYEATISSKDLDKTAGNNGRILTAKEILELDPKQCSAKVLELQKHLNSKAQKKA